MEERPEFMAVPGGFALVDKRKGLRTLTTYLEGRERLDAMRPLVGEAESPSSGPLPCVERGNGWTSPARGELKESRWLPQSDQSC